MEIIFFCFVFLFCFALFLFLFLFCFVFFLVAASWLKSLIIHSKAISQIPWMSPSHRQVPTFAFILCELNTVESKISLS